MEKGRIEAAATDRREKERGKNSQLQVGEFTESVFRDKRGEGWNELFHRQLRETDN